MRIGVAVKALNGMAGRPSLTRSFQYLTGPALGLLLDAYDPFWREGFLAGDSFSELLSPAVRFEGVPEDLAGVALRRAARHPLTGPPSPVPP